MDIQYFITLREVARCQSLTRAAERLGYAQPTISVQIQKLEAHFNTKLLERSSKKLKLTDDGLKLLNYADKIVEAYRSAEEAICHNEEFNLTIGTTETLAAFFLPPYFQAYVHKYPAANVMFFPTSDQEIIRKIKNNEIDIGIVLDTPVTDPELRAIRVRQEDLVVICPQDHPLHDQRDITVHDLHNSSFILTEKGCKYRAALESSMSESGVPYQIVSEMGSIEGIKQCVIYGMGIALIPKIAADDSIQKRLLSSFSIREDSLQPFYTQIIIHKNKHISTALDHMISLLTSRNPSDLALV